MSEVFSGQINVFLFHGFEFPGHGSAEHSPRGTSRIVVERLRITDPHNYPNPLSPLGHYELTVKHSIKYGSSISALGTRDLKQVGRA